jgi:allophanate hydrolase subunit 2
MPETVKLPIQQIRGGRQAMLAVRGGLKAALALGSNAM